MRKLIKIILTLVVILVLAAIVVPFLVPLDNYKKEIIAKVKEQTGRDLVIAGNLKASIFPSLGVEVEKASLSNGQGYTAVNMVSVDNLTLAVDLGALLHKQIQIKRFILDKPVINLEVNDKGTPNWEFGSKEEVKPVAQNQHKTEDQSSNIQSLLAGLMLGDIKISHGEVSYSDARTKKTISLKDLNLQAALPGLSKPFTMTGDTLWNNDKVVIKVTVASPQKIMDDNNSDFNLEVTAPQLVMNYKGNASQTSATGNISLNIPSLPALAKWSGNEFDWKGEAPLAFAVQGKLDASETFVNLQEAVITLDKIKLNGNLKAELDKKVPTIEATFTSDAIDVNPYVAKDVSVPTKTSWLIINQADAAEWSNDKIDLSALSKANAKINLTLGSVTFKKIKLGKTVANAQLSDGTLKVDMPEVALYSGNAKVNATLDSSGNFTKKFTLENVQAGPLLSDAADITKFTGTINASADLNGKITTMKNLVSSLGGNGSVKVTNGEIKGVNMSDMLNNVKSAFQSADTSTTQQITQFSELGGTFTIAHGVVTNKDLKIVSPQFSLTGQGTIDLPLQAIHYKLSPQFASSKAADGTVKQGFAVPIIVDGPLDHPRFMPDLAGLVQNTLSNPDALKNTISSVKDQLKGGTQGMGIKKLNVQKLLGNFGQ